MLSKTQNKYIRSLSQQKFRNEHGVFVAEGEKLAKEWLLAQGNICTVVATAGWVEQNGELLDRHREAEVHVVKEHELANVSTLHTPNEVLVVARKPLQKTVPILNSWYLALDDVQDPGNMGTMIRIADWFGIPNIVCSPGCVDVYNPKVVQSAMGGHLRVGTFECDLHDFLNKTELPVFAATLGGDSIYTIDRTKAGVLLIGNESKGISDSLQQLATRRITIPGKGGAESLNAGVSAGILCALLLPC